MQTIITRRQTMLGGASALAFFATSERTLAFGPWWLAFSAGVASGWLVEALKNWGLVPQAVNSTSLQDTHRRETMPLRQGGYNVQPLYRGGYSGGEFELSEARRGEDFLALSTTTHGSNTCTLRFDQADAMNLGLVSNALRQRGYDTRSIEQATLPMHPPAPNQVVGNRRYSPEFMTPSHGMISWSTDISISRPTLATSIRSTIVSADLRFAQLESGRWTYDFKNA